MPQPYSLPQPVTLCPVLSYLRLFSHSLGCSEACIPSLYLPPLPACVASSRQPPLAPGSAESPLQFPGSFASLSPCIENLVPLAQLPARQTPEGGTRRLFFSCFWVSSEHKFHENRGDTISRSRTEEWWAWHHTAVGAGPWGVGQSLKAGPFREKPKGEASGQAAFCPWTGLKHQLSGLEVVATGLFVCSVVHPAPY